MRSELHRPLQVALLASLPMAGALAGGWMDESRLLGFTTWRAACGAAGLNFGSLLDFTWQLLPLALTGLLLGASAVLAVGLIRRADQTHARDCLAAHLGCALTLPLALLLCASTLPVPLMLIADLGIATAAAWLLILVMRPASHAALPHP